jgi:hypothetical protein
VGLAYLVPAGIAGLGALIAAVIGVIRAGAKRPDPVVLVAVGIAAVGFSVLAASQHDPDVAPSEAFAAVAVASLMLGALPAYGYFVLGRTLAQDPIKLWLIGASSVLALMYGQILGWIFVLDLVYCPPDAYECPI